MIKKRKLNPTDLTWEQRNPTDYIYQPSGDVKWLHKTTKRIKCEAITHMSEQDKWNYSTQCSRNAKYKVFNTGRKETNYYCKTHIKKYYYDYNRKLQYPHLKITLIKED